MVNELHVRFLAFAGRLPEQVAIADAIAEKLAGRVGRPGNSENNSFIDSGLLMRSAIHSARAAKLTRHRR
jgi:hypothetical protein